MKGKLCLPWRKTLISVCLHYCLQSHLDFQGLLHLELLSQVYFNEICLALLPVVLPLEHFLLLRHLKNSAVLFFQVTTYIFAHSEIMFAFLEVRDQMPLTTLTLESIAIKKKSPKPNQKHFLESHFHDLDCFQHWCLFLDRLLDGKDLKCDNVSVPCVGVLSAEFWDWMHFYMSVCCLRCCIS